MNSITRENVKAAFEQIIAQYGEDHTYTRQDRIGGFGVDVMGCFYTLPEKQDDAYVPACIIGQIVHIVVPEALQLIGELEEHYATSCGADSILDGSWSGWSDEDGNEPIQAWALAADDAADEHMIDALTRAQARQDAGGTWGEAYAEYLTLLDQLDRGANVV